MEEADEQEQKNAEKKKSVDWQAAVAAVAAAVGTVGQLQPGRDEVEGRKKSRLRQNEKKPAGIRLAWSPEDDQRFGWNAPPRLAVLGLAPAGLSQRTECG